MKNRIMVIFAIISMGVAINSVTVLGDTGKGTDEVEVKISTIQYGEDENGVIPIIGDEEMRSLGEELEMPRTFNTFSAYPARFDLMEKGWSTGVKNQGQEGLCWAFATMGVAESQFLRKGTAYSNVDFSEIHLGYSVYNGGEDTWIPQNGTWNSAGGNYLMITSTLARGFGLELEENVPFSSYKVEDIKLDTSYTRLKNAYYYPSAFQSDATAQQRESGINIMKKALMEQGALSVDYNASKFDNNTLSFYCDENAVQNHSVAVIGWDDNKVTTYHKPGAWIIKNSWGEQVPGKGIQYISYYDTSLRNPTFYEFEDTISGNHESDLIYQYDEIGWGSCMYASNKNGAVASPSFKNANVFTAKGYETLDSVATYIPKGGNYRISIYKNLKGETPDTGALVTTFQSKKNYFGYYTLPVNKQIQLTPGERYAVVTEIWDEEHTYSYIEGSSYNRKVTSKIGQSYSDLGGGWTDLVKNNPSYNNHCIKAFTSTINVDEIKKGWQKENGIWFYYDVDGSMVTGWKQIGGTWYYFEGNGKMVTDWKVVGGTWYYFEGNGKMVTGWKQLGGTWFYFEGNGMMITGWKQVGGVWYFFEGSGKMVTGWKLVGKTWYFFEGNGKMVTGWKLVGKTWYYMESSGAMKTGWIKLNGTWYYLQSSGAMCVGWKQVGGTWYYFKNSGAMVTGTYTIGGKKNRFAASGAWLG